MRNAHTCVCEWWCMSLNQLCVKNKITYLDICSNPLPFHRKFCVYLFVCTVCGCATHVFFCNLFLFYFLVKSRIIIVFVFLWTYMTLTHHLVAIRFEFRTKTAKLHQHFKCVLEHIGFVIDKYASNDGKCNYFFIVKRELNKRHFRTITIDCW